MYICLVMFYNFVVNFLLILGTDRLSGFPPSLCRVSLAAGVGGVYGGLCLVPSFYFLGHYLWRVVALIATGVVAFGRDPGAARRCVIFSVLCMALSGLVWSVGNVSAPVVLVSAVALNVLCYIGFRGRIGCQEYVKVELNFGGKRLPLIALRDTGNMLQDPVTGQSVLIVNAQIAEMLLGLNRSQLCAPVETVASGVIPGLRLVPYRSVGQANGMMVALKMQDVVIGKWKGSRLVAFAPDFLDHEETYQALTGGVI